MAEQQADYGERRMAPASNQNAPCQKYQPRTASLAESPKAPIWPGLRRIQIAERNAAEREQGAGRRPHAQGSEVQQSEPDGVRALNQSLRRQSAGL